MTRLAGQDAPGYRKACDELFEPLGASAHGESAWIWARTAAPKAYPTVDLLGRQPDTKGEPAAAQLAHGAVLARLGK